MYPHWSAWPDFWRGANQLHRRVPYQFGYESVRAEVCFGHKVWPPAVIVLRKSFVRSLQSSRRTAAPAASRRRFYPATANPRVSVDSDYALVVMGGRKSDMPLLRWSLELLTSPIRVRRQCVRSPVPNWRAVARVPQQGRSFSTDGSSITGCSAPAIVEHARIFSCANSWPPGRFTKIAEDPVLKRPMTAHGIRKPRQRLFSRNYGSPALRLSQINNHDIPRLASHSEPF